MRPPLLRALFFLLLFLLLALLLALARLRLCLRFRVLFGRTRRLSARILGPARLSLLRLHRVLRAQVLRFRLLRIYAPRFCLLLPRLGAGARRSLLLRP